MTLRVLVAQSKQEDALFVRDVIADLEGGSYWTTWTRVAAMFAGSWAEAQAILETEPIDVLLLDLDLVDSQGPETFFRAQAAAPHVPVVLVVDSANTSLAERLLREGAQDFLLQDEMDCAPLARALGNAVSRHRLLAATRASSMTDPLTGLFNRTAFLTLAERDRTLAERLGVRMILIAITRGDLEAIAATRGKDRRDLELVATADFLRRLAGPADLAARVDDNAFAIVAFETPQESVEEIQERRLEAGRQRRLAMGAAVFDPLDPVSLEDLLAQASE